MTFLFTVVGLLLLGYVCKSWKTPCYFRYGRLENMVATASTLSFNLRTLPIKSSVSSSNNLPNFAEDDPLANMRPIYNPDSSSSSVAPRPTTLLEPTFADMKEMAFILANITEHLDTQPEVSITVASQRMGWLYSRDIPKLTQMLLQEFPAFRQDESMMRAYLFLLDFLEAVVKETNDLQETNQKALRILLEAAKVSEQQVDLVIMDSKEQLTKPEFMLYLDAEIESQDPNSPLENMLVTVKLRLLDEIGKGMGVDVMILPKLAAEDDPSELRRKVGCITHCHFMRR